MHHYFEVLFFLTAVKSDTDIKGMAISSFALTPSRAMKLAPSPSMIFNIHNKEWRISQPVDPTITLLARKGGICCYSCVMNIGNVI